MDTIIIAQSGIFRDLENIGVEVVSHGSRKGLSLVLKVQLTIIAKIKLSQKPDTKLERLRRCHTKEVTCFIILEDGALRLTSQLSVPNKEELKGTILKGAHSAHYSVDQGGTKLFKDLRQSFWWDNLKREIAEYVEVPDLSRDQD